MSTDPSMELAALENIVDRLETEVARLTAELADEKAVNEHQRSELQDRVKKQRAAEAELEEARKAQQAAEAEKAVWVRRADSTWHAKHDEAEKNSARWKSLQWHWEGERDFGPGGRMWCSILCGEEPANAEEAADKAMKRGQR